MTVVIGEVLGDAQVGSKKPCLVHGDFHIANVYFIDNQIGWFDF
eukprot:UN25068